MACVHYVSSSGCGAGVCGVPGKRRGQAPEAGGGGCGGGARRPGRRLARVATITRLAQQDVELTASAGTVQPPEPAALCCRERLPCSVRSTVELSSGAGLGERWGFCTWCMCKESFFPLNGYHILFSRLSPMTWTVRQTHHRWATHGTSAKNPEATLQQVPKQPIREQRIAILKVQRHLSRTECELEGRGCSLCRRPSHNTSTSSPRRPSVLFSCQYRASFSQQGIHMSSTSS